MPTYQFEAMDATGQEIRDVIDAATEEEAQTTIRAMGYFVTKISVKKQKAGGTAATPGAKKKKRSFSVGGASSRQLTTFTRNLSILQDAGLPILRSLRILEMQAKPGKLKNALLDICDEIETGSTLSESMSKSPKVFSRLYVNMIKAGEAGGALEIILRRLADFMERSEDLKRKVKGALIYPVVIVLIAVLILTFIMWKIVPVFEKMFREFELELPPPTQVLIALSTAVVKGWFLIPLIPITVLLFLKLTCKFKFGRAGWDTFVLRIPIFGPLVEKNIMARTTRTLGTLVASGVPILEALNITRETADNFVFERLYGRVSDAILEGEKIAQPMRENSRLGFHPMALFFFCFFASLPFMNIALLPNVSEDLNMIQASGMLCLVASLLAALWYMLKMRDQIVNELVINMVDVGEETGELDKMLYKVADTFDEEVKTMTDGLMKLMEPLMIVFLGFAVGFIVISLFMPLVSLLEGLA